LQIKYYISSWRSFTGYASFLFSLLYLIICLLSFKCRKCNSAASKNRPVETAFSKFARVLSRYGAHSCYGHSRETARKHILIRQQNVDHRVESETFTSFSFYQGKKNSFSWNIPSSHILLRVLVMRFISRQNTILSDYPINFSLSSRSNSFYYIIFLLFCEDVCDIEN